MPLTAAVLRSMLGRDVAVSVAVPTMVTDLLFPEERQHIFRAVEKRQAEFGTARLCARQALAQLGLAPCPLVPYPDRSPRWPQGIVGTISHTTGCCVVAVAKARHFIGLGLDVEMDTALWRSLEPTICTEQERAWLDRFCEADRGRWGKLLHIECDDGHAATMNEILARQVEESPSSLIAALNAGDIAVGARLRFFDALMKKVH